MGVLDSPVGLHELRVTPSLWSSAFASDPDGFLLSPLRLTGRPARAVGCGIKPMPT